MPALKELDRYFKVTRIFQKFLCQDEELVEAYKGYLEKTENTPEINMIMTHDFIGACTNSSYQLERY